jgi:DNA-binding MarR family transcriptional regulator
MSEMKKLREGGFLVTKIHHLSGRIFYRMLKAYGLDDINPGQGRILFALWKQDGVPIQELARRTQLGKSTLTSMLDRLEAAGFLKRVPSCTDRRKVLIELTEKNKALQQAYEQVSEEMTRVYYKGFADAEIDRFELYLQRILDNLIKHGEGED